MKFKHLFLSLSLAGAGLCQLNAQESQATRTIGDVQPASSRSIGDVQPASSRSLGDGLVVDAGISAAPSGTRTLGDIDRGKIISDQGVSLANTIDLNLIAPSAASYASSSCTSGGACDGSCDGSCGSSCGTSACSPTGWMSAEVLLWFTEALDTPPLVTNSALGVLPVWQANGVTTAFGGANGIENGLIPGLRIEGGRWLDDCQNIGIGGRFFGFIEDEQYNQVSDGSFSIGVPFFNANPGVTAEDAYLVAYTAAGPVPVSSGSVSARSDLDLLGSDGSLRMLLAKSANSRFDLIGGYSYHRIKNSLTLTTQSTNLFTGDLIPDGTVFDTLDVFETNNEFHGGHVGLLGSVACRGLTLSSLAKVSFGNMRQTGYIFGETADTFGGNTNLNAGGIFARTSNIGTYTADAFAFIPEIGIKMGYDVRDNVKLTAGYTFLYYSNVALAGDQMDRAIDLAGTVARPAANFVDSSLWVQGIDLGLNISF